MPFVPDLNDPRYLDEIGWFLYHERFRRSQFGGSYDEERLAYSGLVRDEVLEYCGEGESWLADKTVVSIGAGCTGDLSAWPAAVKIAVDPLIAAYQQLGMLLDDVAGAPTIYLAAGVEEVPLLDESADLVLCRNALDHMPDPGPAMEQMWRILKQDALLFLSVDLGGFPTPDEPSVFTDETLAALLAERFTVVRQATDPESHSGWRTSSTRVLARKKAHPTTGIDREELLQAYMARLEQHESTDE